MEKKHKWTIAPCNLELPWTMDDGLLALQHGAGARARAVETRDSSSNSAPATYREQCGPGKSNPGEFWLSHY